MSAGLIGKASTSNTTSSAAGRADVRHLGAARDLPGRAVAFDRAPVSCTLLRRRFFIGPSIAYIAIRQGAKCRMAAKTFDEMRSGAEGTIRAPYRGVRAVARQHLGRAAGRDAARGRPVLSPPRHHLRRLRRGRGQRDHDPVRHHPARHGVGRMGVSAQGPGTAGAGAQRLPGRRLRRARDLPRRRDPRAADPDERRVRRRWRRASSCRATCMPTSRASTWCGSARRTSTSSRTMCARRRACPTCWRTAKS